MPFDTEIENPWKNREAIPYPKMIKLLPIALIYVLAALVPVFFMSETTSLIAYVGLCAGVIYVLRMPRIAISVILASFVPIAFFQSFSLGAMVLAIVAGTGCGAVLLTSMRTPWRTVILPAVAWVVAFAITRDAAMASLTLITVPASILLAVATWTGQRRTTAICYTIGGFLISVLALLAVYFVVTYGSIDRDVIISHFETQREWIVGILTSFKDEMLKMLTEQGMQSSEFYTTLQTYMSREALVSLVALVYNVLPAVVIVICSIMAYEAQSFLCGAYCNLGMKQMLTPASVAFTMSTVSAIIYLLTFFITMIVSSEGLFMAVVQNFSIILTPGFFLIGYASLLFRFRTAQGGAKFFLIFLLIAIVCCNPWANFSLLAFFGAITVLISAFGSHMMKKMQDQMPGDGAKFNGSFGGGAWDQKPEADQRENPTERDPDTDEDPSNDENDNKDV